jgi:Tfp pilus assembly protein PilF
LPQLDRIEQLEISGEWLQALRDLRQLLIGESCQSPQAFHLQGRLYQRLGRTDPARRAYQQALQLEPRLPRTLNNLALLELGVLDAAAADHWLQRGLALPQLSPADAGLLFATGCSLRLFQLRATEALALAQAHLELGVSAAGLTNAASCWHQMGRFAEARQCQHLAVRLHLQQQAPALLETPLEQLVGVPCGDQPSSDLLRTQLLNFGIFLLCFNPFDRQGLALLQAHDVTDRSSASLASSPARRWAGEPCGRLILWDDQGYGDTLQNLSWVLEAANRVQALEIWLRPALLPLVRARLQLPAHITLKPMEADAKPWLEGDCQLGLFHLPMVLGCWTTSHRPAHRRAWNTSSTPSSLPPRIGLVWRAGRHPAPQPERSARLRDAPFPELWALAMGWKKRYGAELLSLQLDLRDDPGAEQAQASGLLVQALHSTDWLATAEVLESLDLLVSVDTSVAHLAGVLGVPCCLLLPCPADWRWGQTGSETWIYPTMALARCGEPGAWSTALAQLSAWIEEQLSGAPRNG